MLFKTLLHEVHTRAGGQFESRCGWDIVSVFSDPLAEYEALRHGAGILDVSYAGKLRFSGKDRVRYLNSMLTNDIRKLEPWTGCYAALLTRQGLMESDLWVYALPDELWVECPPCATDQVLATLSKHIVSERVDVVDMTHSHGVLSVQGPATAAVLASVLREPSLPPGILEHRFIPRMAGNWLLVNRDRSGSGGYDLWIPAPDLEQAWRTLSAGGRAVGWRALNWARTEAGIPWYGLDMNDRTLPMEVGLDAAISMNKGCYRGQEIVARVTYRGKLDRSLAGIAVDGTAPPAPGAEVTVQEQKAGVITSAAFSPALGKPLALAVIKKSFTQPGTAVEIRWQEEFQKGTVVGLPV